jgi:hypothetical protein
MWFLREIHTRKAGRAPARVSRFLPRLETLEGRDVPSTLTVTNPLDKGAGSLRDAISKAKDGDTIVFASSLNGQTITLTSGELAINTSLDIEGPGASQLAISGNDTYRVLDIGQGVTATIAGLTITHGQAQAGTTDAGGNGGGAILNAGTLTVANDVLSSNQSQTHGGAISNGPAAVLTVTNSAFMGNQAIAKASAHQVEGGAIWNGGGGSTATVIGSAFIGNQAIGGNGQVSNTNKLIGVALGGAIHNDGSSTLTVQNSTFIGNQAIGGNNDSAGKNVSSYFLGIGAGGAITNDEGLLLAVSGCTFRNNQAIGGTNNTGNSSGFGYVGLGRGGALSTFSGAVTVTNSTFDHNEALGGNGNTGGGALLVGVGDGGGIVSDAFGLTPHPLTVSNCTFTNNEAMGGAGNSAGVFVGSGMGGALENFRMATATVTGSTFSGNQAIGGLGSAGQSGDARGGALSNLVGSTLTVSGCTISGNQAIGGAGGSGGNGGNGFGGGVYNQGESSFGSSSLTVTGSTVTGNTATGGAAGGGGNTGQGIGGGCYFGPGGAVCLDPFTVAHLFGNHASTSDDDIFGDFTTCP